MIIATTGAFGRRRTLAGTGFERHRKIMERERFLWKMDHIVPWRRVVDVVAPCYPTGERGRPPVELERILFVYCLGHWYRLSVPALEETLYDTEALRRFLGINLGREAAPDQTTRCTFRQLLDRCELDAALFAEINAQLADQGVQVSVGTIVDATIIDALSSTKNQRGKHDPEVHQTQKGTQSYFGMKGHPHVESTKLIPAVVATPVNTPDGRVVGRLLHSEETHVWGDKAYDGRLKAISSAAPAAQNHTHENSHRHRPLTVEQNAANRYKSKVRPKVEPPNGTIKPVHGFCNVHYRRIVNNANRLFVASGLTNLFMVRKRLLAVGA